MRTIKKTFLLCITLFILIFLTATNIDKPVKSALKINTQKKLDTTSNKDIKIGDYISFAKYYNKPILWRVINIDEDKNVLIFSDKILCLKSFDSGGKYHKNSKRQN